MRGHTRRRARLDALVLLLVLLLGLAHEARPQSCPNNAQLPGGATQWPSCACNAGYTNTSGLVNLARQCAGGGCTVTGISEYTQEGFSFSKLVNGNTQELLCAHTNTFSNDWMMIDLEQTAFINHVRIFNRVGGCCDHRINNFQIRVGYSSTFSNNPACAAGEGWFSGSKNFSCVLSGRYLSIQQFNTEAMNLAELEVYGRKTSNLARACSAGNCPVTGTSDYGTDWALWRAVDGITSSYGAHTLSMSNDWIMIDMQQTVFVAMVRIYNRQDCCQDRINNFQIRVGDSGTSAGSSNPACASNQPWFSNPNNKDFICVLSGRYVTLQQFNSQWMNVAEVEVYGLKASEVCTGCFAGTFKSTAGSAACADCGAGKYQDAAVVTTNPPVGSRTYSSVFPSPTHCSHPVLDSTHAWCAESNDISQWMQIDLGSDFRVHGVVTQCRAEAEQCVTEIEVQYSLTTSDFVSATAAGGSTRFILPTTYSSTLKTSSIFSQPVTARYIRINVRAWLGHVSMRAAVLTLSTTISNACADCGAGTYSAATGATAAGTCQACPGGTISPAGSDALGDCVVAVCPAGSTGPDGGTCTACAAGKYKDIAGVQWSFRTDESPYGWQEAYDEAAAAGRRLPTVAELRAYINSNPSAFTQFNGLDRWTPVVNPDLSNTKDFIQIGNSHHARGNIHTPYPSWGDSSSYEFQKVYTEVLDACADCGAGTYSAATGATAAGTCQSCPTNSQSTPGSDAATDCVCVVGFSGPDGGACAACVAGKYKANPGSADCTACLANSNHALTGRTAASACQCNAGTRVGVACACPLCPACLAMIRPALSCRKPDRPISDAPGMTGHTRRRARGCMLWALVLSLVRHGLAQTGTCPAGTSAPIKAVFSGSSGCGGSHAAGTYYYHNLIYNGRYTLRRSDGVVFFYFTGSQWRFAKTIPESGSYSTNAGSWLVRYARTDTLLWTLLNLKPQAEQCSFGPYYDNNAIKFSSISQTLSECTTCNAGKYAVSGENNCNNCPTNSQSVAGSTEITNCLCNVGYTGPNGGMCTACAAGKYKDAVVITTNPPLIQRFHSSISTAATGFDQSQLDSPKCWAAASATQGQWMLIDLGSTLRVHGLVTQCRADTSGNQCVTGVTVTYDDQPVDAGNTFSLRTTYSSSSKIYTYFDMPVMAQYIKIFPVAWIGWVSMRAGVLTSLPDTAWNVCADCGAGKYSAATGATVIDTCQSCPTNSQSTTGSDTSTDCVCVVGFSGPDGGACTACAAGKYKANPGSAECTACLPDSYHALTGRTAASACQCNAGTRVHV
jgi:phage tail protein X